MSNPYEGDSTTPAAGIIGTNSTAGPGVSGSSQGGYGVEGNSATGNGVYGTSKNSDAVVGFSGAAGKSGVLGLAPNGNAVTGISDNGTGVLGTGKSFGVVGTSASGEGVHAHSDAGNALHGDSAQSDAVVGYTAAQGKSGVLGLAPNGNAVTGISDNGTGVYAKGGVWAGYFDGKLGVRDDIILTNGDCAEDFEVIGADTVEPGTVVVIDRDEVMQPSHHPYDRRVAGVIAGAAGCKPGLILGRRQSGRTRMPVALMGRVYCKVDARFGPIAVGDLLTTSPTPGHAMKTDDPLRAFGAVIGKALQPLHEGQGLIPVLIALQ